MSVVRDPVAKAFSKWYKRNGTFTDSAGEWAAWQAATTAERERCARMVELYAQSMGREVCDAAPILARCIRNSEALE